MKKKTLVCGTNRSDVVRLNRTGKSCTPSRRNASLIRGSSSPVADDVIVGMWYYMVLIDAADDDIL